MGISSFRGAGGNARHIVFLQPDKQKHNRNGHHHGSGAENRVIFVDICLVHHGIQALGHGIVVVVVLQDDRDENEIREYLSAIPNSLVELRPDLVEEWHPTKNGNLRPDMFGINSNDHAWWKCSTCGHEWQTTIIQRGGKRKSGCPECSKILRGKTFTRSKVAERGSLAENNPTLAKEWHPTKNGELTPNDITPKRFKNVWWLCPKCGYEWEASPNNRSKGVGCPCCSGRVPKVGVNDFQTLFPELVVEWDVEKNTPYMPNQFLPKSGKKVWWRCRDCDYEWQTVIRNRTNGHGCPVCARKNRK